MDVPDDSTLLASWRCGDGRAGRALVERHYDSIYRFFSSKIHEDVEDLVQATFMVCVENRDKFEGRSKFRTYLFGIARFKLFEHFLEKRRARREAPRDFSSTSIVDFEVSPSTMLRKKEDLRLLHRAIRLIPLDDQLLLELYLWERFTGPELARVLEVPENTVRSRIHRAKRLLRSRMWELAQDGRDFVHSPSTLSSWVAAMKREAQDRYPEVEDRIGVWSRSLHGPDSDAIGRG